MPKQWMTEFGHDAQLLHYTAPGCRQCQYTGMLGRVGMHELLVVNPALHRLIQIAARPEQLQHETMGHEDLRTQRPDHVRKVMLGLTTIEEVRANSNR